MDSSWNRREKSLMQIARRGWHQVIWRKKHIGIQFPNSLEFRAFWYLSSFSYSSFTFVSLGTVISIKSAVLLSFSIRLQCLLVCVQSRGPSVCLHPKGFWLYRLYHLFSGMSVLLFRMRQVILLTQTPVDNSGDFVMSLLIYSSCASLLHIVLDSLFHVPGHSASHIAFLFVYFYFDDFSSWRLVLCCH